MKVCIRLLAAFGVALLADPSLAQIPLSGPLSDSTTGPLTSGNVYHVAGSVTVPVGQTLTIDPNVVSHGERAVHGPGAGIPITAHGPPLTRIPAHDN